MVIPGAYASNGAKITLTSSNPNIVEVVGQNQIIAHQTGHVTLQFNMPENESFAAALTRTRTLEVIKPTWSAWLENRKRDPRYHSLRNRFLNRRMNQRAGWTENQAAYEFDADHFDSDGDGYSNLFERATAMDSLGFDQQNGPLLMQPENGKTRISFVRYANPLSSTGEQFQYLIEESLDLRSWMPASVVLESQVNLGAGMERLTYEASQSTQPEVQKFLRLKIRKIN